MSKKSHVKNCDKREKEGLLICQRHQAKEKPKIVFLRFSRLLSLYITIDHRLGFAPRFYRSSNPSRYFCQLYHQLSSGVLVTRKQPGDIIRACLRKSTHFGVFTYADKGSRSEIRYQSRIRNPASFQFREKSIASSLLL